MLLLMMIAALGLWGAEVGGQHVISTAQGELRGEEHEGYVSYRGIPYASVAGNDGKFKKAGLAPVWSGSRQSAECRCSAASRADDCLQLDVHVPAGGGAGGGGGGGWPALAWLAGGAAHYTTRQLVLMDIIVVVVHHRIGPLGFLCAGDDKIPGNAAVKDVVLALRWIQDNLVAFRGNPARVVVGGQSLGAAIAEALTLSPMADGLYHGAILQSGTVLAPWAFNYDAQERATMLAQMLSKNENSTSVLMSAQTQELVEKSNKLNVPYFPFGMCIETPLKREERLLSEAPIDLLNAKRVGRVPMIIGFNSDEAYIFASVLGEARVSKGALSNLLPQELRFLNDREISQMTRQIEDMYFKNNMSMRSLLSYHRDAYFVSHVHRSARLHSLASRPVFYYRFSYSGGRGVQEGPEARKQGAAHSDELAYLFSGGGLEGDEGVVQKNLLRLWTNFVKYLSPTHGESLSWDAVDPEHPRLLDVSQELQMTEFPHAREAAMWDDIFHTYYYSRNRASTDH